MQRKEDARLADETAPTDRYRTLIELSPQVVWEAEPGGGVTWANQWWLDYCGFGFEQIRGNGWVRTVHPDHVAHARQTWIAARRSADLYELEVPLRRGADGQYRWFLLRSRPLRDAAGGVLRWLGIGVDIHDRRTAEQALRRSEQLLREREAQLSTVTDTMPQIVWSARPDGRHDFFNARWHAFTGLSGDRLAWSGAGGSPWADCLHPDDRAQAAHAWRESLETGVPYEAEYRLRRHDGAYRWFIARALPLRDEAGGIVRWFGTCTDIEDQKGAELALKEADRLKDEFLAMLGHELRNPLAPMANALRALEYVGGQPDQRQRCLDILQRQLAQMKRLVDDLLEVGRITQGRIRLRPVGFALDEAVRAAVETVRPALDLRGHALVLRLPPVPLRVVADPLRIAQAVTNLLHNAAKYTQPGGHIEVSVEAADDGGAAVRVADDGPGIPEALLPRIFELFTQGERTIERAEGGLGIGLALVQRLMHLHGGSVRVESAGPGRGAAFTLWLPPASAQHNAQAVQPAERAGQDAAPRAQAAGGASVA